MTLPDAVTACIIAAVYVGSIIAVIRCRGSRTWDDDPQGRNRSGG